MLNFFSITFAEKNDQLTIKISKNLRCVICQGQSIYDSQSDFAVSMKLLINKKIEQANLNDALAIHEIIEEMFSNQLFSEAIYSFDRIQFCSTN